MSEPEITIRSWDDPTLSYGIKDAETFYRVYGHESRFYIATGPDADQSIRDYQAARAGAPPVPEDAGEEIPPVEGRPEGLVSGQWVDGSNVLHNFDGSVAEDPTGSEPPVSEGSPEF